MAPSEGASMTRRLRLFSGLVMLAYVTMHLLNHAVGLISLEAMENVLWYIFRIWTNRPAQLLLYCSFLVHYALALYAPWQRRTLRLRASELSQVVLGFAIPFLLVRLVVTTRISDSFLHTDVGYYAYLLWVYFVRSPEYGFLQMLVLVVAWGHAMIGLHFWPRVRHWYARLQPTALVVAVLVPVLSLLGAIEAGRQVTALAADPNWIHERITLPSPEAQSSLDTITELLSWFFAAMVGAVLLARVPSHLAASPRPRAHRLSGRSDCRGNTRHQRARGELPGWHPACLGMRGPRPLFDLSHSGARRDAQHGPSCRRRATRTAPHWRNIQCSPRLPVAAARRGRGDAAAAAFCACRGRAAPSRPCAGQRARDCDPVRRHSRLHRALRRPASL